MTKDYSHLIGETFGELTIFDISEPDTRHRSRRKAESLCECGKSCSIDLQSLLNGSTKSCGHARELPKTHMRYEAFVGRKFGKLTIEKVLYDENAKRGHKVRAFCKCDCGNKIETNFYTVKNGYKTSCGCEYEQVSRNDLQLRGVEVTNTEGHSTGIRNITTNNHGYQVQIQRYGILTRKFARTLEDATKLKESIINEYKEKGLLQSANRPDLQSLIGKKFNHLTILEIGEPDRKRSRMRFATCQCDCGKITKTRLSYVTNGKVKSCGHIRGKVKSNVNKPAFKTTKRHSTGVRNITTTPYNMYCVSVSRNGVEKRKYVKTFEEALEVKQQFLKDFGEK